MAVEVFNHSTDKVVDDDNYQNTRHCTQYIQHDKRKGHLKSVPLPVPTVTHWIYNEISTHLSIKELHRKNLGSCARKFYKHESRYGIYPNWFGSLFLENFLKLKHSQEMRVGHNESQGSISQYSVVTTPFVCVVSCNGAVIPSRQNMEHSNYP